MSDHVSWAASNRQRPQPAARVAIIRSLTCSFAGIAVSLAMVAGAGNAVAQSNNVGAVLAQMDVSSKNFHSAEATIKKEQYERLVHDTTTQTGSIYFLRSGSSIQMGAKYDPPASQVAEYKNGTVRLYSAGTNHIDTYSAAKNQAQIDTFVTLGFGGSGTELAKAWNITDQGPEQMDGVKVEKLDLVSKEASVRDNFTRITVWIDPARDITLKQEFFDPGGNTNTVTYSNIRVNQPIKDIADYAIKCKGKCD